MVSVVIIAEIPAVLVTVFRTAVGTTGAVGVVAGSSVLILEWPVVLVWVKLLEECMSSEKVVTEVDCKTDETNTGTTETPVICRANVYTN